MNLLNAYVKLETARPELSKNYFFKSFVVEGIKQVLESKIKDIKVYLARKVCYIEVLGIQFSFHDIGVRKELKMYLLSEKNVKQKWKGIRLQTFSSLIFNVAEELRKTKELKIV